MKKYCILKIRLSKEPPCILVSFALIKQNIKCCQLWYEYSKDCENVNSSLSEAISTLRFEHPPLMPSFLWFSSIICLLGAIFHAELWVQSLSFQNYWLPMMFLLWFYKNTTHHSVIDFFFLFFGLDPSFASTTLNRFFSEKNIPEALSNLELSSSQLLPFPLKLYLSLSTVCENF